MDPQTERMAIDGEKPDAEEILIPEELPILPLSGVVLFPGMAVPLMVGQKNYIQLVDEAVVRADPNRTIIPGIVVDAVVVEPWGAHPSYVQGHYDRDNRFYRDWDPISRDAAATDALQQRLRDDGAQ